MAIHKLPNAKDLELLRTRMSTQFQLPSAYDDALSSQGLIYKLIQYLKDTMQNVEDWNIWLEDFVQTFETRLQETVREKIQELYDSGKLAELTVEVIDVVQDQIDDLDSKIDSEIDGVQDQIHDLDGKIDSEIDGVQDQIHDLDGKIDSEIDSLTTQLSENIERVRPNSVDDTENIQNALNKLGAGTILLVGTGFIVSDTILLDSNQKLMGSEDTTITLKTGTNKSIVSNKNTSIGNENIVVENISFHGNKEYQQSAFSVLDFTKVKHSAFRKLKVTGGKRTGVYPSVSAEGEGLQLKDSSYNLIEESYFYENDYDGIKLRSSDYNILSNVICENNGRSGIQLSFVRGTTKGSDHNVLNNIIVRHNTGIPSEVAPTTSGIYVHTGNYNNVNGFVINGTAQGLGLIEDSSDNLFTNGIVEIRYYTHLNRAIIDVEAHPTRYSHRNTFNNIKTRPLSGENGLYIKVANNNRNTVVSNCDFTYGLGTGKWTLNITGENTKLISNVFPSSAGPATSDKTRLLNIGKSTQFYSNVYLDVSQELTLTSDWKGSLKFERINGTVYLYGSITLVGSSKPSSVTSVETIHFFPKAGHSFNVYVSQKSEVFDGFYVAAQGGGVYMRPPVSNFIELNDTVFINTSFIID